jgi:hypothetical protein
VKLFVIDAIGPFFRGCDAGRMNWSKIPFANLERDGLPDPERLPGIEAEFERFCRSVAARGFNTITLDDLAHLFDCALYGVALREKIGAYRDLYRRLFAVAQEHGLQVFITTDVMFLNAELESYLEERPQGFIAILREAVEQVLGKFPAIAGVIFRIGESDGVDVEGDFRSRLVVRTPRQARELIQALLPVFESRQRLFIFRTWSVGAYRIGDLMWNRDTFEKTFGGIHSPWFVISQKHGETDFFRYIPLSDVFFQSDHQKILELQARREYEGFGEFPSFIGWDCEAYRRALKKARNLIGVSVWCQTGGWGCFHRRSYLEPEGLWNEINAEAALRIFKDGVTPEGAVRAIFRERWGPGRWDLLLELLALSDEVVKELLYVDEFASRHMFFRRLRVPPLLWVYWDHILVNHSMRKVLRCFVHDGERKVTDGYRALKKIRRMEDLARELGLPAADLAFQHDTFEILAMARVYFFRPYDPAVVKELGRLRAAYYEKYPRRYTVHLDFSPVRLRRAWVARILGLLVRHDRSYRRVDRLLLGHVLSWIYPLLRPFQGRWVPAFARKQAMGWDVVFK